MALDNGTRLGPYEIHSPIGAGGMGEVYKATDTRLDRTVAIKVLPEHLAKDPERKKRLELEAKAISQLNHPHICTLYDVGEQDGIDYLVMEYIEGETLADALNKGGLPLDQALEYGKQIADGLDRAHRAGIVHRDLKPGNVMLTKPGVKILDFGLARVTTIAPVSGSSDAPTQQRNLTDEHSITGTLQYMAPELLEGMSADERSDHWAFGCVLFEMLTGRKAFEGGSQASLISAIMAAETPVVSSLRSVTPPALDRLVNTCLAKDPNERWQSAGDLRRELAWIASSKYTVASREGARRHFPLGWAVAAVVALMLGLSLLKSPTRSEPPRTPLRFSLELPPDHILASINIPGGRTSSSRSEGRPTSSPLAISRDGSQVVCVAEAEGPEPHLFSRDLSSMTTRRLPDTEGANAPFFSPDGEWVGFHAEGRLWKSSFTRGTRSAVCDVASFPLGITWLADDTIVYGDSMGRLMRVPASGGDPEVLTEPESSRGELQHFAPHGLPDGQTILFTVETESGPLISALDLSTKKWTPLFEGRWPRYIASGFVILTAPNDYTLDLMAIPFDAQSRSTSGKPITVLQSVYAAQTSVYASQTSYVRTPFVAISETGTIAYVPASALATHARVVSVDRQGRISPLIETTDAYEYPRLSPDGSHLAYILHHAETTGTHQAWVYDLERGTRRLISRGGESATRPFWTRDGAAVVYSSAGGIYVQPLDNTERQTLIARDGGLASAWLPSGDKVFTVRPTSVGLDILAMTDDGKLEPVVATAADEHLPRPSPDGRWIAYASNESGNAEVYMRPYPGPGRTLTVSVDGGTDPVWSPVGNELFYRNGGELMVVPVQTQPHAILGRPRKLFELPFLDRAGPTNPGYDVTKDGQHFITTQPVEGVRTLVQVIVNWDEELRSIVSVN